MQRILFLGLIFVVLAGILYACNTGGATPTDNNIAALSGEVSALKLTVSHQEGTFNTVGQIIAFQFSINNTGTTSLVGPATISITNSIGTCQGFDQIGDKDNALDPGEIATCTASYAITQADLNAGEVKLTAVASVGGVSTNQEVATVKMTAFKVLELTGNVDRTTYNQANQVINFTFIIRNTGTVSFGPAQFSINSDLTGRFNCLGADITLSPGASISCPATYTTKDADRSATQLTFNFTASGGGAESIQPLSLVVQNTSVTNQPGNYTKGTTITHDVIPGEWLLQIARCYGADLNAIIKANPQVKDPAKIWPVEKIIVPNIGSNGQIYGPKCVIYITAQASDTWNSIAAQYNADINVLMEANQGVTLKAGVSVRVPRNSAGGITPAPTGIVPIRLNFPPGSDKVTLSGILTPAKGKERHVLTALQGQILKVTLTAPAGGLELAVLSVGGTVLKAQNATLTYSGPIPSNGDYYIDVVNVTTTDKQYSIEVALTTPVVVTTERVFDLNPGAADANPSYMAVFNNALYFSAIGDNTGNELWRFNAATNKVEKVKDLFAGAESSNPSYLAEYNGALYFGANGNDGAGVELWRFNGSDTGRLTDLNAGGNFNPTYMTVYGGYLYFSATGSDGYGTELWRTDGVNTMRVTDIYPGEGNANPAYLAVFGNNLYFSATSNDGYGTELWKYDGTTATRVTDINPNVGNANPAFLRVYGNNLYFSANANNNIGTELWKFDGTNATLAADINPGSGDSIPSYLIEYKGELYFSANANDGTGYELFHYNGSNFARASDVNKSGDSFPAFLVVYNNQLYFQANGGDGTGKELWRYLGP